MWSWISVFLACAMAFSTACNCWATSRPRPLRFDHVNDAAQVAFGAAEALDDLGMALVDRVLIHGAYPIPPERK
jgi:hypothetical protein